ncbi:MAG TPA: protein-disulfide reductase DsbD N-terminal domain-containing protein [Flavobacteriales bacterium]|nr:protein-disulfide reductase DsbD N-terminal domain-containing protein [Flavobacteriales bacterium]
MRIILLCLLVFFAVQVNAQGYSQVKWDFSGRKTKNSAELILKATIEKGWHVYSQHLKGDGPIPTQFTFQLPKGVKKAGETKEPEPIKHFDQNFGMNVLYFEKEVEFTQELKGKITGAMVVTGQVTYMICNDEMCYPPVDVAFEIKL